MGNMMWIYIVIIFFSVSWSHDTGTNGNSSTSTTTSSITLAVHREADFTVGSNASLTCSNKTWNDTIYVIWTIKLKHRPEPCRISYSNDFRSENTCNDGKTLQNTSSAQSYLNIQNFSADDVGIYTCESVYRGGSENHIITVTATVPPNISARFAFRQNKNIAVCRAEGGNPAANISWIPAGNGTVSTVKHDAEGYFTVENVLELPDTEITENLTCVISHKFWKEDKNLVLEPRSQSRKAFHSWMWPVILSVIPVLLVGISVFALTKLKLFRKQTNAASKPMPPIENVEEVEPYACYIQRVNSIYN